MLTCEELYHANPGGVLEMFLIFIMVILIVYVFVCKGKSVYAKYQEEKKIE